MKKALGAILCVLAVFLLIGTLIGGREQASSRHKVQTGAAAAVLLALGIALSQAKKKPADTEKK